MTIKRNKVNIVSSLIFSIKKRYIISLISSRDIKLYWIYRYMYIYIYIYWIYIYIYIFIYPIYIYETNNLLKFLDEINCTKNEVFRIYWKIQNSDQIFYLVIFWYVSFGFLVYSFCPVVDCICYHIYIICIYIYIYIYTYIYIYICI